MDTETAQWQAEDDAANAAQLLSDLIKYWYTDIDFGWAGLTPKEQAIFGTEERFVTFVARNNPPS